ncbi:MAG: hypothetical protein RJB60_973 [Pseudomonadota bacterium]
MALLLHPCAERIDPKKRRPEGRLWHFKVRVREQPAFACLDQTTRAFSTKRETTQFLVLDSGRLSVISTTSPILNSLFSS